MTPRGGTLLSLEEKYDEVRQLIQIGKDKGYLLYDEVKLEGRFDECAMEGGGFKLAGVGKEFISYLLCLREPSLFGIWNTNSERVLRRVGSRTAITQTGPLGIQYLDVLDGLAQLRNHIGLKDFRAVDEACYCGVRIKADR